MSLVDSKRLPFKNHGGHCVLGDLQYCRNVLVPFPRSVLCHNPDILRNEIKTFRNIQQMCDVLYFSWEKALAVLGVVRTDKCTIELG